MIDNFLDPNDFRRNLVPFSSLTLNEYAMNHVMNDDRMRKPC